MPDTFSQSLVICAGENVIIGMHTYTVSGTYVDVFTNSTSSGCDSTVITDLTVNQPHAEFGYSIAMPICGGCGTGVNVFTDSSTSASGDPIVTWSWKFPGASPSTSDMEHPFGINYPAIGNYTVCHTVSSLKGCKDSIYKIVNIVVTSVNESENESLISIFPNPTNGKFTVQIAEGIGKITDLDIRNMLGEKVYQSFALSHLPLGNAPVAIDLSGKSAGIYFLTLKSESGITAKKIIIQR